MSENQDAALKAVLQFTPGDLTENRAGKLSRAQHDALWERRLKETATMAVFIPVFMILIILFLPMLSPPIRLPSDTCFIPLLFLVLVGIVLYYLWTIVRLWRRYSLDLRADQVESIAGLLIQSPKQQGRYTQHAIEVLGRKFKVPERTMLAFQNGGQYRVYYVPHSQTVVAAESLR